MKTVKFKLGEGQTLMGSYGLAQSGDVVEMDETAAQSMEKEGRGVIQVEKAPKEGEKEQKGQIQTKEEKSAKDSK